MTNPIEVEVIILEAADAKDANAKCKQSKAYRQICEEHPSSEWHREHTVTVYDEKYSYWRVKFEVRKK